MKGTASVTAGPVIVDANGYPATDLPIILDDSGYAKFSLRYGADSLANRNRNRSMLPSSLVTIYPDVSSASLQPVARPTFFRNWMQDQLDTAPNVRAYGYTTGAPSQNDDARMVAPCSVYIRVYNRVDTFKFTKIHANVASRTPGDLVTTYINTPGVQDADIPLSRNEWASFNLFDKSGNDVNAVVTVTLPESSDGDYMFIGIRFYAAASWPKS